MTGHLHMLEWLEGLLAKGQGNATAITARIAFHREFLAKHGVFVL